MTPDAPPAGRGLRTAVVATVVVVVVAIAWLVVVLVVSATSGWPNDGPFAVLARLLFLVLLVGWLASLAGVVLGIVARVRFGERRMLAAAIGLMPVALLGCIGMTLVALLYLLLTHPLSDNPAADAGRPLSAALRADGGSELCTAADPGLGPDNTQPWYTAYLEVPRSSVTAPALDHALERSGFTPTAAGGTRGIATATIDVLGVRDVEIDCASGFEQWGHHHTAAAGSVVLEVQVSLPGPAD